MITGGCGFIGKNLATELLNQGAKVTILDLPNSDWVHLPKNVERIRADIMNAHDIASAFEEIDIVYHLAARTDIEGKHLDDYKVNFEGTRNLINECAKNNRVRRFIFFSTQLVVGLFDETRFIDETEPYRTKTIYGRSKIKGEEVVKKYCSRAGVNYTIIRPTSVYGPWGGSPYKEFFYTIKNRKYFHVGKAKNLVSLVYVKNLVDLTILASLSRQAENEIYFGNDFHPYTMREIADTVANYYKVKIATIPSPLMTVIAYVFGVIKLIGFKVPIYPFRLRNIKSNYCYDIGKSVRIGYKPRYDLAQGIKESLDWYEVNGVTS